MQGYCFQGCTRFAVKLDFLVGLLSKALTATGGRDIRGHQALLGEAVAWRHLFWSLTHAMCRKPDPWVDGALLPNMEAASPIAPSRRWPIRRSRRSSRTPSPRA